MLALLCLLQTLSSFHSVTIRGRFPSISYGVLAGEMVFLAHFCHPIFDGDSQIGNLREGEVSTGHAGVRASTRRGAQLPMARTRMQRAQNRIRLLQYVVINVKRSGHKQVPRMLAYTLACLHHLVTFRKLFVGSGDTNSDVKKCVSETTFCTRRFHDFFFQCVLRH